MELRQCSQCGAPVYITSEHLWLDNGDIVQKRDQEHRLLFIESENFDPLFHNMEQILGASIEETIITCVRRAARLYLKLFIPEEVSDQVKKGEIDFKPLDDAFMDLARPMGAGSFEFVDMRYQRDENDYFTVSVTEPYSLPMCVARHAAAMEAILGYNHGVTYKEVSPGMYHITAFPSEHCS